MSIRQTLPNRRASITTKIRIGDRQRTVYLTMNTTSPPLELFIRIAGTDCSPEIVGLFDSLARMISLALQYGASLDEVSGMLCGSKFSPAGIVTGHPELHFCSSVPDAIGQHLLTLLPDQANPSRTNPAV